MPRVDLSDRFIATLKPKEIAADYFDSKARGLNLRVTPTGVKAWSVMFTSPRDGKRARFSLGTYPATPLAKARTLAIEARGHVEAGTDPRDLDRGSMAGGPMTVAMLAEAYLEKHASGLRSRDEIARKMRSDVLPVIGGMKITEVRRGDIHRVLDPIKDRGSPASAMKVHADIRAMFHWAVKRGLLDINPAAGMDEGGAAKARKRFLSEEEIAALWPALSAFKPDVEFALRFALVTGQRIGEVCGMTDDELDLAKGVWTIPAARSKNGEEHKVPLSQMALELLAGRKTIGGRFVTRSAAAIAQALDYRRDSLPVQNWTAQDLRRTCCTHLAMLGVPPLHIGAVVNHKQVTKRGVILGVYVQYDYAKEKREALELWANRLAAILAGDATKVVPMRSLEAC